MNKYSIPTDMSETEKIIGGVLTLVQLFWIILGVAIGALGYFLTYKIIGVIAGGLLALVLSTTGFPFAFYHVFAKNELTFFQMLRLRIKHKRKIKKLKNYRKEVEEKWAEL